MPYTPQLLHILANRPAGFSYAGFADDPRFQANPEVPVAVQQLRDALRVSATGMYADYHLRGCLQALLTFPTIARNLPPNDYPLHFPMPPCDSSWLHITDSQPGVVALQPDQLPLPIAAFPIPEKVVLNINSSGIWRWSLQPAANHWELQQLSETRIGEHRFSYTLQSFQDRSKVYRFDYATSLDGPVERIWELYPPFPFAGMVGYVTSQLPRLPDLLDRMGLLPALIGTYDAVEQYAILTAAAAVGQDFNWTVSDLNLLTK